MVVSWQIVSSYLFGRFSYSRVQSEESFNEKALLIKLDFMLEMKIWNKHKISSVTEFLSFSDIDECGLNETLCSPHGFCENRLGSFQCLCDQGYQESQDGQGCVGKCRIFGIYMYVLYIYIHKSLHNGLTDVGCILCHN